MPNSTRLSDKIRDFLKSNMEGDRPMTQSRFVAKMGEQNVQTSQDYVSKVISGVIRTPKKDFVAGLAKLIGHTTIAELEALALEDSLDSQIKGERPQGPSGQLQIVFGHSVWSAPIVDAICGGRLKPFDAASFSTDTGDQPKSKTDLRWLNAGLPDTPRPGSMLAALSASDVVDLLNRQEAHIGAMPGNIVPEEFVRLATITDSVAGCVFVCTDEFCNRLAAASGEVQPRASGAAKPRRKSNTLDCTSHPRIADTRLLGDVLQWLRSQGSKIRVAVEENTVGYEFLRDACMKSTANDEQGAKLLKDVTWCCPTRILASTSFSALQDDLKKTHGDCKLIGIVAWEPHCTWIQEMHRKDGGTALHKIVLHFSPEKYGRPRHYSYELVVRGDLLFPQSRLRQELQAAIPKLIYELQASANYLNKLTPQSPIDSRVQRFANYYGYFDANGGSKADEALAAISSIRYSVMRTVAGFVALNQ